MYEKYAKIRDDKGMTDYKVAQSTGISSSTFSEWKSGHYTPKIDKMIKIAQFLGVDVGEIIGV